LRVFIGQCHDKGLKFMHDLVINHTSIDSGLIEEHPGWYVTKWVVAKRSDGRVILQSPVDRPPDKRHFSDKGYIIETRVAHPSAIDPNDSRKVTIWGDLAEIDNRASSDLEGLIEYWQGLVDFYLDLGMDGFRCDAAYKMPGTTWKNIIGHARKKNPDVLFVAETLGCKMDELEETVKAGFDYIFNSSKYWDYTAAWAPEQYELFRKYAPSISFPESHDTARLAAETNGRIDVQKFRYLFAAFFSAGIMMPVGYEFGFKKELNVVTTRPKDWEQPLFDLSEFITKVNAFKQRFRCLNEDGPMKHFEYGNKAILVLRKTSPDGNQHLLLVYNKDWHVVQQAPLDDIGYFLDLGTPVTKVGPEMDDEPFEGNAVKESLGPNEYRFFLQEREPCPEPVPTSQ
jgi:starch synthase (maltosyl-transferring)